MCGDGRDPVRGPRITDGRPGNVAGAHWSRSNISPFGKCWPSCSPIDIQQPLKFPIALLSPVSVIACFYLLAWRKSLVR